MLTATPALWAPCVTPARGWCCRRCLAAAASSPSSWSASKTRHDAQSATVSSRPRPLVDSPPVVEAWHVGMQRAVVRPWGAPASSPRASCGPCVTHRPHQEREGVHRLPPPLLRQLHRGVPADRTARQVGRVATVTPCVVGADRPNLIAGYAWRASPNVSDERACHTTARAARAASPSPACSAQRIHAAVPHTG